MFSSATSSSVCNAKNLEIDYLTPNFAFGNQTPSKVKTYINLKIRIMKKLMMTVFITTLIPVVGSYNNKGCFCHAEELSNPYPSNWPDVLPVYDSYYDSSTNQLCIYGAASSTVISVRVSCRGKEVLNDHVSPEQLPAWYDFSDYDSGTYLVLISAGDTILSTFSFTKE